jgi:hypothetical protein
MDILATVDPFVGRYFSEEYIRKYLLKQDDQDIIRMNIEMNNEAQLKQQMMMQQQIAQQQMGMGQQEQQGEQK